MPDDPVGFGELDGGMMIERRDGLGGGEACVQKHQSGFTGHQTARGEMPFHGESGTIDRVGKTGIGGRGTELDDHFVGNVNGRIG